MFTYVMQRVPALAVALFVATPMGLSAQDRAVTVGISYRFPL